MAAWLAQDGGGVDLAVLGQYGVLGIVAVLLIMFARVAWRRETDRGDRLEAENQRLNNVIMDKAVPALEAAARAVEESTALLAAIQRDRERERDYIRREGAN